MSSVSLLPPVAVDADLTGEQYLDSLLDMDDFVMFNDFVSTMESPTPTTTPKRTISALPSIASLPPSSMMFAPLTTTNTLSPEQGTMDTKLINTVSSMTLPSIACNGISYPPMCVSPSPSDASSNTTTTVVETKTIDGPTKKKRKTTSTKKASTTTVTNNKKRRRVTEDSTSDAVVSAAAIVAVATATAEAAGRQTAVAALPKDDLTVRLERNREHAKKSRQRKKALTQKLQTSLKELKEENENIKKMIMDRFSMSAVSVAETLESKKALQQERFVKHLQSKTLVLDNKTIQFFQSLRKDLPK